MRIVDAFAEQCTTNPHRRALQIQSNRDEATEFSWADLARLMHQTIVKLNTAANGQLDIGDCIATCLPNGLAWILVDLASQWMGWVHVALDTRLPHRMALDLVQHSRARLIVTQHASSPHFAAHLPTLSAHGLEQFDCRSISTESVDSKVVHEDSPAQLLYTSGTVLQPKGALLSHRNLYSNAKAKLLAAPQLPSDVRLNILPFAHAYARTCELSTWILSGSELCVATNWDSFMHWAPIVEPTLINLVPHLVYRFIERLDCDNECVRPFGSRLRLLQVGGAALRKDIWQRMSALGWPPLQGYGLTETSPVICSNRAGSQRHDTVGPPVDGVEIHIDRNGVLWTRGPHVMLGYWQDEVSTREKMRDGWFCTGDLAEQLGDGSLRILGRVDDQITLSTGYKVAPLELVRRLSDDPWIEHVVLVGQDRPFIAAVIYPRLKSLPAKLHTSGSNALSVNTTALENAIVERWRPLTSDLPRSMQIERVAVMKEPPTIENGGLNFKGAVRRQFVEQVLCRDEVEKLYGYHNPTRSF